MLLPPPYDKIRKQLNGWLKLRFGQETVEFHYRKIKPVIIAEEFLKDDDNTFSSSLVDYKVWCFNGKAFCICTYYNRTPQTLSSNVFDTKWNLMSGVQILSSHYILGETIVPKPECLDQLIEYAERLSEGHPQMRVDFYVIKNKIYFGEITMTSAMGFMGYFTQDFLLKMGQEARRGINL